jgi:LCP family protein required for cell wall assembly
MILVTVDPNSRTAGMLSVPRDLWVSIPGYGEDRVNKAYFFGEKNSYPGGGPALAMKTVQYNLGVPVHFYAQIDFQGFRDVIDTLDGIDVTVPETIDDPTFPDSNYGYDPFYIEAGQHTLNGYDAVRYARTRATRGADFARARRQQQVLLAIRDKALRIGIIPKIPELWATMSETIETDLQLVDILELAQLSDEVDTGNIQSAVIDSSMTIDYIVPDTGAQVLLPLREKIRLTIDQMFAEVEVAEGPTQEEIAAAQAAQLAAQAQARAEEIEQEAQRQEIVKAFLSQENARLVVQNGTNISNLASQTALYLKNRGFNIVQFSPADTATYPHSVIVVYSEEKDYTLQVLSTMFEVEEENIRRSPSLKSDVDFRVIIGSDFELPASQQTQLIPEE